MPRGPNGEKRPTEVIGAAIMVGRIATGEIEEPQGRAAGFTAKLLDMADVVKLSDEYDASRKAKAAYEKEAANCGGLCSVEPVGIG